MAELIELLVGSTWAYRASWREALVQVVVLRLGVKRPPRVLVRWVDETFEGQQDWVSPARLKVPWDQLDEFVAREQRWDALTNLSPDIESLEEGAISVLFDELIDRSLATIGYGATTGVMYIHDVEGLAAFLHLAPTLIRDLPVAFEEDGALIVPWPITKMVGMRAAQRDPHAVLAYVELEEADARRKAQFGHYLGRRHRDEDYISPDISAQVDSEHGRPIRAFLREWAGQEPVDLHREISELRTTNGRLAAVAARAIETLRQRGNVRDAYRIAEDLEEIKKQA